MSIYTKTFSYIKEHIIMIGHQIIIMEIRKNMKRKQIIGTQCERESMNQGRYSPRNAARNFMAHQ